MKKIRALIIDDEPLARDGVRMLLESDPDIAVVGECADGEQAVKAIAEHEPDLVFLDVQMPEMTGFDVIAEVGAELMPAVVFVTAYDKYALKAFEVNALDYLLKPFSKKRFEKALERAKAQIAQPSGDDLNRRLTALLQNFEPGGRYLQRVVVKAAGRVFFLGVDEIDWIEAEDIYVRVHAGRASHLIRGTMGGLEARLDPARFLRIQRSTIVNVERIKELHPLFHGEYVLTLKDGTQLTSGRSYRDRLRPLIENPF
ncbi:MAG TPA: LytTR family DNA-binding domain-containing protein [Pyrinomonadaceae bacterium]|nr:LytTR family DNA-binding domain-containing protein [Pyrinomonadaceae bacterium]